MRQPDLHSKYKAATEGARDILATSDYVISQAALRLGQP